MMGNKANIFYLIMGIVIIVLVVAYYVNHVYNQIKDKMILPSQQKIAAIEAHVKEVEQRVVAEVLCKKDETTVISASYHSDATRNGNMSLMYADLSEGEAAMILENVKRGQNGESSKPVTRQRNLFETTEKSEKEQRSAQNKKIFKPQHSVFTDNNVSPSAKSESRPPSNIFDDPLDVLTASESSISEHFASSVTVNQQAIKNISDNIRRAVSDRSISPLSAALASPSPGNTRGSHEKHDE
jgi:Tfp pilus assembly protein PilN